jgi:hypothetical protein
MKCLIYHKIESVIKCKKYIDGKDCKAILPPLEYNLELVIIGRRIFCEKSKMGTNGVLTDGFIDVGRLFGACRAGNVRAAGSQRQHLYGV